MEKCIICDRIVDETKPTIYVRVDADTKAVCSEKCFWNYKKFYKQKEASK